MKKIVKLNEVKDYDLLCITMEHEVVWHDDYIEYEEDEKEDE